MLHNYVYVAIVEFICTQMQKPYIFVISLKQVRDLYENEGGTNSCFGVLIRVSVNL